jgi:hypothetical protein
MRRPRRFGCEGYPLSEQPKTWFEARTGETWNIYDKALLELVSQDDHLSLKVLSDLGDPSSWADAIGVLAPGHLRQRDVFTHIPKSIIRIARAGHAIIVGQGGAVIPQTLCPGERLRHPCAIPRGCDSGRWTEFAARELAGDPSHASDRRRPTWW